MPGGTAPIPDEPTFSVGTTYNRRDLHDQFGGQRYGGISTPRDYDVIFLFTGEEGEQHGYRDEFHGEYFVYTGEGREGDMTMTAGNKAIRDHQGTGDGLHLFESDPEPYLITYVGAFEYVDHFWETLPDTNGNPRDAVRFKLAPVGGTDVTVPAERRDRLSDAALYEQAKAAASGTATGGGSGGGGAGRTYRRSELVQAFARRMADGVCQGCGEPAPFIDESGEPYLEVHHLHRRSDGGPDDPENVIALCPNCHRRVHYGEDGDAFNEELIAKAEARNAQFG